MFPYHVKAKSLSTYCLDLYGSQLWKYSSIHVVFLCSVVQNYKTSMEVTTHCSLLTSINDSILNDIVLEQRCAQFIWSCLNSYNTFIKTTALSVISSGGSTFGDNYRYLSYKYNIGHLIWLLSLNEVIKCFLL